MDAVGILAGFLRFAEQRFLETDAVEFLPRFAARDVEERGQQVFVLHDGVGQASRFDFRGVTGHERAVHARIPAGPFAAGELRPLLAEEHDDRIVELACLFQHFEHRADLVVERADFGQIVGEDLAHFGIVHAVFGHHEFVLVELRRIAPCPRRVRVDAAHVEQERIVVAGHEFADAVHVVGGPLRRAAYGESGDLFEFVDRRSDRVVLAGAAYAVTLFGHVFVDGLGSPEGRLVVLVGAVADGVETRVHRGADGYAHGDRGVVVGEPHPFVGQSVDVGGYDVLSSVAAQLGRQQVVGHDHHDVGPVALGFAFFGCHARCGQCRRGECGGFEQRGIQIQFVHGGKISEFVVNADLSSRSWLRAALRR